MQFEAWLVKKTHSKPCPSFCLENQSQTLRGTDLPERATVNWLLLELLWSLEHPWTNLDQTVAVLGGEQELREGK